MVFQICYGRKCLSSLTSFSEVEKGKATLFLLWLLLKEIIHLTFYAMLWLLFTNQLKPCKQCCGKNSPEPHLDTNHIGSLLVPASSKHKSLYLISFFSKYPKEINFRGDQFLRHKFLQIFLFFGKPAKICLREIALLLLSTKINPCEILVKVFQHTVSVLKTIILLLNALNHG